MSHETRVSSPVIDALEVEELTGLECDPVSVGTTTLPSRSVPSRHQSVPVPANEPKVPKNRLPLMKRFPNGINWVVTGWMTMMHIGGIAAFWYFSWSGLALLVGLHFVTACLGITLGYHRLLTHNGMTVPNWFRGFVSICGMLSAEGSPLQWVATHRKHHVHSDGDEDPHSPNHGSWWSHMLWFAGKDTDEELETLYRRWAPDMYKDPMQQFFHKTFILYPILLGVILYGLGQYFFQDGLSWVLWGLCLRMVVAYHSTWFVNSATHIWGYRNYETTDRSRNLWWVAILSYGEGWHNNHHAHQLLARHGHRWWEFDVTYQVIRLLKWTGIAKNVHDRVPEASGKTLGYRGSNHN